MTSVSTSTSLNSAEGTAPTQHPVAVRGRSEGARRSYGEQSGGGLVVEANHTFAPPRPESWRLVGRPYDPRQRALSRGEQRVQAVDRLVYGGSGVLAALVVLYAIAQRVFG